MVRDKEIRSGAEGILAGVVVQEYVGDEKRSFRRKHAFALEEKLGGDIAIEVGVFMLQKNLTVFVHNFEDRYQVLPDPAVGEYAECFSHVRHAHLATTKRQR